MTAPTRSSAGRRRAYEDGIAAEDRAARVLLGKGYAISARRLRTAGGEIDLVAEKPGLVVFVEVRFRKRAAAAVESVSLAKQKRLIRAALGYLAEHPEAVGVDLRFDVICLAPGAAPAHIENAFSADGLDLSV